MPTTTSERDTYIRTVCIPIAAPTASKAGLLNRQLKHYLRVRQYAARHFQQADVSARDATRSDQNELRKQIASKPDVDIHSGQMECAITEVVQNYEEYERDPSANPPWPEGADIVSYRAKQAYLFHSDRWYLCLPGNNDHIILPLLVSNDAYHSDVLPDPDVASDSGRRPGTKFTDFSANDFDGRVTGLGQCSVVKHGAKEFELHLSVKRYKVVERSVNRPRYIVGVDRGRNELLYACLYDRAEDHVTAWKHIGGSEIEHYMDEMAERIREVQKNDALDDMNRLRKRRMRHKRQKDYELANVVVSLARGAGEDGQTTLDATSVAIAIEDLAGMSNLGNYSTENRRFNEWSYYRQQQAIEDKAEPYDIPVIEVEARGTSQRCSRCASEDTDRHSVHFECRECGYQQHADANAAVNIAKKL